MRKLTAIAAYIVVVGILALFAGYSMYNNFQRARMVDDSFGAPARPTWEEFITTIEAEQDVLLSQYGDYIQYINGQLYYRNQPINNNRFKNLVPANTNISVYTTPSGQKGFQVFQTIEGATSTHVSSFAIGPEAEDRTYEIDYVLPTI